MDKHDLDVRLVVAEAKLARATKRLKYLRDSALYGYQDDVAYRAALFGYHAAQRELLALRGAAVLAPRAA
jgi:hypothetical protein